MKFYIYTADINSALKGDFRFSLRLSTSNELSGNGWHLIGETDLDPKIDREQLTIKACSEIDKEIAEIQARTQIKVNELTDKKQKLLALTMQS